MYVVGATRADALAEIRKIVPNKFLLIPGVGAQGGDLNHCVLEGNKTGIGIINVSRDISFSGDFSEKSIRESALSYVEKINEALSG